MTLVAMLLAGCTSGTTPLPDDPDSTTATTSANPETSTPIAETPSTTTEPPTSAPPAPDTSAPTSDEAPSPTTTEPDDVEDDHPWLTAASSQNPGATPPETTQEIIGIRTGLHEGFDRVVLELSGDEPVLGWFAGFTDEAVVDPSGQPLEVAGEAFLELGVHGIDWTNESPERYSGEPVPGGDLEGVTEVVFGGLFEAQQQIVIGLDAQTAYRVFALSDPARIVIDIRHD